MNSGTGWDPNLLIGVLTQGEEQIRQLEAHLNEPSTTELCKSLAQKIQSTFQTAISMAKSIQDSQQPAAPNNNTGSDSLPSASDSPRSENSDRVFKDHERREMCKKRKSLPKWSSQVRVCSGGGIEGPMDDGYSWRKYGQKDILGANFPRGYYRCTHRNSQGCLATKQVQRSDEDPSIFDVTYRGVHTCLEKRQMVPESVPKESNMKQNQLNPPDHYKQQNLHQDQQLLLSLRASLKVKTKGLDSGGQAHASSSSFSFPSTPVSCMKPQSNFFSSPSILDNHFTSTISPTFMSTTTSESNYFSLSPCQMSNYGGGPKLHPPEPDFTEIISTATSTTNSPMVDMDFVLEPGEFDPHFPFDGSNFF